MRARASAWFWPEFEQRLVALVPDARAPRVSTRSVDYAPGIAARAIRTAMLESRSFRGYVVLVVEDDPDTLDTTTFLIADLLGCQVLTASSGHQALRLVEDEHVDLVFTDIVMPRMDGLTLTSLIRQRFPAMPVVVTTGLPTAMTTAHDRGAVALIKPYQPEQLVAIFSEQLLANATATSASRSNRSQKRFDETVVSLESARDRVARAEAIILKQAEILRRLKKVGGDTAVAEWTLRTFQESLAGMRRRLAVKEYEAASRQAEESNLMKH